MSSTGLDLIATCASCGVRFASAQLVARDPTVRHRRPAWIVVQREGAAAPRAGYRDHAQVRRGTLRVLGRREWLPFVLVSPIVLLLNALTLRALLASRFESGLPHALVGLALLVAIGVMLARRLRITIDGSSLTASVWPSLWRSGRRLDVGELRTISVVRPPQLLGSSSHAAPTYTLFAELSGATVVLATGFTTADEALYVAQTIEDHVGIREETTER
ncbi:hypothetical protein [Sandaracinus amylolyticus]|uniref:hypothetical protein n=1 Tax=Sandaracinus amylolyticus TaxID=927083 RepID=UPI001F478FE1|nr:hypothetical protein [Sandaracinus amylolyticus]